MFKSENNKNDSQTKDRDIARTQGNSPPQTPPPLQGIALANQRLVQLHIKVDALTKRLERLTAQRAAPRASLGAVDKGTQLLLAQRYRAQAAAGLFEGGGGDATGRC